MVIAGDYEPKGGKKDKRPVVAAKGEGAPSEKPKRKECRIKVLGLCI